VRLEFPDALPVSARRGEIGAAIAAHPVVIVSGETGSGKTTQLPKICLAAGRGTAGLIGHTQPRRIAATSIARRIAEELGTPLGQDVGYKIRFGEQTGAGTRIKLMTDGILLAETLSDPHLRRYDTLIVDEAHERSLNIDFLLGYLHGLLRGPRRDDLRVVITSATIDAARFADHFAGPGGPAPIIEVSGRTYPVEIRWRPPGGGAASGAPGSEAAPGAPGSGETARGPAAPTVAARADDEDETDLPAAIEDALDELWAEGAGDVLVFLPGEREIRETAEHLRRAWARRGARGPAAGAELLPLYARLSAAEQQRVFAPGGRTRVVLATNVAETSLTVPGIRYVVDTGLARVKRYRYRGKVEQLQIEPVSQAAARQRAGRCGRVQAGVCIRLYDEADFARRPPFTDPEILRSSLAAVILRMKALRLPDIDAFAFVDPPPARAVADGLALLRELDAVDAGGVLTDTGRQLARLPVDPRVGRMLLAARHGGCLREVLVLAAALSVQDPRERPPERAQAADQAHARFTERGSDFVGYLRLWDYVRPGGTGRQAGESNRAFAARLDREFLSVRRLREWADVHGQLTEAVGELRWHAADGAAPTEAVHRALLAGLLGNLGCRVPDEAHYLGSHGVRFWLHPGSALARRAAAATGSAAPREGSSAGRWVMAAELVETTRLYARTVARIEPAWVEQAAGHLIQRSWGEPHWEKRAGQAMAFERGTLYGLVVYAQRRVPYAPIEPQRARELLIRGALVGGDWDTDCAFFAHNRRLIAEVEQLEAKMRRPDLLVDDAFLFDWYDRQIPADVTSGARLERWWRQARRERPGLLELSREQLMRKDAEGVDHRNFPRQLVMHGMTFDAHYHFDPGADDDGVTLEVPMHALNQVDAVRADWLVPGMLPEKVTALLKSLPPKVRRLLVPLDAWAARFVERAAAAGAPTRPLVEALIEDLREHASVRVSAGDFRLETLAAHLSMNFRVVDEHGRFRAMSRQLARLRAELGATARGSFQAALARVRQALPEEGIGRPGAAGPAGTTAGAVAAATAGAATPAGAAAALREAGERFVDWSFESLPELLELRDPSGAAGATLVGYPALVDDGDAVRLQVLDDPQAARRAHRGGVARLFALALREPLRSLLRGLPDRQRLALAYAPFGGAEALERDLAAAVLERTCLADPLPADRAEFEARVGQARPRIGLVGQALARTLAGVLAEHAALARRLAAARAFPAAQADVAQQVAGLLPPGFVASTPGEAFGHLERYLKAASARLDKLRADPARDAQRLAELAPLLHNLQRVQAALKGRSDPRLEQFRWLLEELRVSLFAQELRTPAPVSVKRLQRFWDTLRS
jgi:ATP-dependent helicase HrpA